MKLLNIRITKLNIKQTKNYLKKCILAVSNINILQLLYYFINCLQTHLLKLQI